MEFKYSYYSNSILWINGIPHYAYNAVIGPKTHQLVYQVYTPQNTLVNIWVHHPSSSGLSLESNEYIPYQRNSSSTRQVASSSH